MNEEKLALWPVNGVQELIGWFGHWPSFHDTEILEVHLSRDNDSQIILEVSESGPETDEDGHFIIHHQAIVRFILSEITELFLSNFSEQNVISDLVVEANGEYVSLEFKPCYGLSGRISAKCVRIELEPCPIEDQKL